MDTRQMRCVAAMSAARLRQRAVCMLVSGGVPLCCYTPR